VSKALARYITDEVQDVYRLQGVKINDKHIEVIVRQMLRRVQFTEPGDTRFITGEQAERSDLLDENDKVMKEEGKQGATYEHLLLGQTIILPFLLIFYFISSLHISSLTLFHLSILNSSYLLLPNSHIPI
jgi:hypothetical protein